MARVQSCAMLGFGAVALAAALWACADDGARGPDTGTIVAHAVWPEVAPLASAPAALHLPAEVVTVRCIITAGDIATPVQKDFDALLGRGTIDNVPVGSDRTLTIQGLDTAGTVLYEGVTTGLTVVAGQTTDAGPVQMDAKFAPGAPTGVSVTAGDAQVTISWSAVSGATSYNLYWSTTTGVTKTTGTKITGVTSPYPHTGWPTAPPTSTWLPLSTPPVKAPSRRRWGPRPRRPHPARPQAYRLRLATAK